MKKYSMILIAVTIVSIIVGFAYHTRGSSGIRLLNSASRKMETESADFGKSEVKEIKIDVDYEHFYFVTGEKLEVTSIFPEEELPKTTFENGVLTITQDIPDSDFTLRIRNKDEEYSTKIVIPEGTIPENIDIQGRDVDVVMDDITGKNLITKINDGDIDIKNGKFTNVTYNHNDGDISLDGEFGIADVNTDDGEVTIKGKYEQITAYTNDGDITVDTESDIDINKIKVYSENGHVTVNGSEWK